MSKQNFVEPGNWDKSNQKMSARQAIQVGSKTVRPVLSLTQGEAKRRVLNLYKAWYRQIPYLG